MRKETFEQKPQWDDDLELYKRNKWDFPTKFFNKIGSQLNGEQCSRQPETLHLIDFLEKEKIINKECYIGMLEP